MGWKNLKDRRKWQNENRDKVRKYNRKYLRKRYWQNLETERKRSKEYYRKNKKYFQDYYKRPEVKEKTAINEYARRVLKEKVFKRYKHKCKKCGSKENLQMHHTSYQPNFGYKGVHNINNIILLCRKCHRELHHKPILKHINKDLDSELCVMKTML